jgi:predicted amino acid racemase
MAFITFDKANLKHNYNFLDNLFKTNGIDWGVVTKLLCGNELFLKELIQLGVEETHDSRISNLKTIKSINPKIQTVYIKPPAKRSIKRIVQYADVSFNTEIDTIRMLSKEAVAQNKTHKIIIMIEMGDLREGVMGEELINFYGEIFELPNIEISGIGTNLNCLHGVMPSPDKLIQLSLYEQLIEAKFNKKIPFVTGGTSVVVPLLLQHNLPAGINHFRIGEMLYFGNNLFTEAPVVGMKTDVLKLYTEIIELTEKPRVPTGNLAENPSGEMIKINPDDYGKTSYRAILDVGLLDVNPDFLISTNQEVKIVGASSDMLVIDLGADEGAYKIGDLVSFDLKYMGALSLLNSDYIEKKLV